jgi:predicted GNAT family acetyltransferase
MNEDSMRGSFTHDPGEYLNRVGDFLRMMPVEHNVLLSNAARRARREQINEADLWLWVEAGSEVVAAALHTPPHGAYLSTGPSEAMRLMAQMLWEQRPWLAGVAGPTPSPEDFADEWVSLGGPPAVLESREGTYIASRVDARADVLGALRIAEHRDADLLRAWATEFMAETGLTTSDEDLVGPRIEAGRMFVWEVDGQAVAMAAVTDAHGGVSRVQLVFTPPQHRKQGFASACVAAITTGELANPGRLCMLYTDVENPTSNKIYQEVGYRRVGDTVQLRFPQRRQ